MLCRRQSAGQQDTITLVLKRDVPVNQTDMEMLFRHPDLRLGMLSATVEELEVSTEESLEVKTVGIMVQPEEDSIRISDIIPGSSAASELRIGDVVMKVDDVPLEVSEVEGLMEKLVGAVGSTVSLTVSRRRDKSMEGLDTVKVNVIRDVPTPLAGLASLPEIFPTRLWEHLEPSTVGKHECGFGCGFRSISEVEIQEHEYTDCTYKDATNNVPQKSHDTTKRIKTTTFEAFQCAVDGLRSNIHSAEALPDSRPHSPITISPSAHIPASAAVPDAWQFRCLGSGKIAGKYRRGDEVVCEVSRIVGEGKVDIGDIGIVLCECWDLNAVLVRFQVGEIELDAHREIRKCLYQDILRIEVHRKAQAELHQKDELLHKDEERRPKAEPAKVIIDAKQVDAIVEVDTIVEGHPQRKDSFLKRITRSFSTRNT